MRDRKHITETPACYWVRFCAGNGRKSENVFIAQATFNFKEHGGKRKALQAARVWRDNYLRGAV